MLSKAEVKYINSLQNKKYRRIERAFFVEGYKNVLELLNSDYEVKKIFVTNEFLFHMEHLVLKKGLEIQIVTSGELASVGTLETNNSALAIAVTKDEKVDVKIENELILVLDGINDPGNLGTIIRTADWYGIKNMVCSLDTVDLYNPKVINATKGSYTRLNIYYRDLSQFFMANSKIPVLAAFMDGVSIYNVKCQLPAILLLGNEANGINNDLVPFVSEKVTIPRIGNAESLNVGIAAGILIDRLLC
ncbi:MAG: RNA methyltransferase [Opitutaceae bacterium]|nr:RNA methyltransferase [Cytophagales bacterium]